MKHLTILLAVVLTAVSSGAAAQEPLSFKGFELGAERAAILASLPNSECTGDTCYWRPGACKGGSEAIGACFAGMRYGGVMPLSTSATFRDGKLVSVLVMIGSNAFDSLAAAMTERFGKPDTDQPDVVHNRMGASFDNRKLRWIRGDAALSVTKRSGKIDEGSVFFISQEYLKQRESERARDTKAKAKDL